MRWYIWYFIWNKSLPLHSGNHVWPNSVVWVNTGGLCPGRQWLIWDRARPWQQFISFFVIYRRVIKIGSWPRAPLNTNVNNTHATQIPSVNTELYVHEFYRLFDICAHGILSYCNALMIKNTVYSMEYACSYIEFPLKYPLHVDQSFKSYPFIKERFSGIEKVFVIHILPLKC